MKVLYIPGYYFPVSEDEIVTSGDLRYSINLAIGLSNNGHDVTILNKRFNKYKKNEIPTKKYESLNIEYYNNGLYKLFDSSFDISFNRFLIFRKLIKNSDIVISNTPLGIELLTLIKSKKKYIYNVSGLFDKKNYRFSLKEIGLFLFVNLFRDSLKKLNFKIAHKVNTSSYFEIEDLKKMNINKKKLISISSGYDSRFYFPKFEKQENILLTKRKNSILHVSRITPAKGIIETIEAFSVLNKNKFELKIIGNELSHDNSYKKKVKDIVERFDNVELILNLEEKLLPQYFRNADLTTCFSLNYDPLPTVIIESMACGTPVISSYYKSREQFIQNNINGIFVYKNDKEKWALEVENYFSDLEKIQLMSKNAYYTSKKFELNILSKQFIEHAIRK